MLRSLIIGARGEIGSAIVTALRARGDKVAALDIAPPTGKDNESFYESTIDVRDNDSVTAAIGKARDWLGGIDVFVNSAGIMRRGSLFDVEDTEFEEVVGVNLVGAFRTTRAVAFYMRDQKSGCILHVCSLHALVGMPERSTYAASKGGLTAFVKALAAELGPLGITINALAPGPIGSGMGKPAPSRKAIVEATPMGRIAMPEDVADYAAHLSSKSGKFITGQVIAIDGGVSTTLLT